MAEDNRTQMTPNMNNLTPANSGTDGMAVTSLVTGILAIVFCWIWPVALLFIILASVFGGISYSKTKNGMALAGIICAAASLVLTIVLIIIAVTVLNSGGLQY
jgi:hypothetical protein